jgi:large subunit ribosomal protein L20
MPRVKRGVQKRKRKKNVIKMTKGFKWRRKSNYKEAKDAIHHAWTNAYRDRKRKKGDFRRLWQIQINAACRENEITYSKFIDLLKKKNIAIDRKILADLAINNNEVFKKILAEAKER